MLVGIDAREAHLPRSGKAHYTYNLIRHLIAAHPECHFVLYTKHYLPHFEQFGNAEQKVLKKKHLFWHIAVMRDWAQQAATTPDNAYFAPTSFIVPALLPRKFNCVITIHDLIAFNEKTHQAKAQLLEKLFIKRAINHSAHILVPSQNTAEDLKKLFPQAEGKIIVTPLGIESRFYKVSDEDVLRVQKKYLVPKKYILTVAGLEPRKNVSTLVNAFLNLPELLAEYRLVIVGGKGWRSTALQHLIAQNSDKIMHLTEVSFEDLPALYAHAEVFVYPSLYEGFGLPPLEAMAAGCPVICSHAASLPEVCGEAALMIDPHSVTELQTAIIGVLSNTALREKLVRAGTEHAKKFTWKKTAERTYKHFVI